MTDRAGKRTCDISNQAFQSGRELREHRQTEHPQDKPEDGRHRTNLDGHSGVNLSGRNTSPGNLCSAPL
jgi:hypothetical protein